MSDISFETVGQHEREHSEWLIPGYIYRYGKTIITGRPKVGKNFLALSAAMAIASGTDWLGEKVEKRKVLYWSMTGKNRETSSRVTLTDIGKDLLLFDKKPADSDEWWDGFYDSLIANGVEVVFISNLFAFGRSVYDQDEMTELLARLDRLYDLGLSVVLLHHSPKESEESGAWNEPMGCDAVKGFADWHLHIERDVQSNDALMQVYTYGFKDWGAEIDLAFYPKGMGEDGAFLTVL